MGKGNVGQYVVKNGNAGKGYTETVFNNKDEAINYANKLSSSSSDNVFVVEIGSWSDSTIWEN